MNRRGFLSLLAATPALAVAPDLAELLAPTRTIFLPPVGGWATNQIFTVKYIAEEALRILEMNLESALFIHRDYSSEFIAGDQWSPQQMRTLVVRRPPRYAAPEIRIGDKITIEGVLQA